MRHLKTLFLLVAAAAVVLTSCTDTELCYEADHPHRAGVKFSFDLSDYTVQPDTMMIICNRIINSWRSAIDVAAADGKGHFIYNAPQFPSDDTTGGDTTGDDTTGGDTTGGDDTTGGSDDTTGDDDTIGGDDDTDLTITPEATAKPRAAKTRADGDDTPTDPTDPTDPTEPTDPTTPTEPTEAPTGTDTDLFTLPVGTYKFVALSHDTTQMVYDELWENLEDRNAKPLSEVYVSYKTYELSDEGYKGHIPGWEDNNDYGAKYIQRHITPLYYDTIAPRDIAMGNMIECRFAPKPVTQNIDIYLTITKAALGNPFTVDSVEAEIAGVPVSINLATGNLDITRTAKIPFPMERYDSTGTLLRSVFEDGDMNKLVTSGDTKGSTSISCHANIDATGIVRNSDQTATLGPGIMQLVIYITVDKQVNVDGVTQTLPFRKMIQGKINLYNTLTDAKLLDYLDGGNFVRKHTDHGVLDIIADIVIDGDAIVEQEKEGFDTWKQAGAGKDIEIEL